MDKIMQIPVKALGLSDVEIVGTRIDNEGSYIITVKSTKEKTFIEIQPLRGICCDMCNAALEVFGKSTPITVDRFHVAKLYRKSLITLRKKELIRLRKELSEE